MSNIYENNKLFHLKDLIIKQNIIVKFTIKDIRLKK